MKAFSDGVLISSPDGRRVCRVFAPGWRVWRWIAWLLLPAGRRIVERRGGVVVRMAIEAELAS